VQKLFWGSACLLAMVAVRPVLGGEADRSGAPRCAACGNLQTASPACAGLRSSIDTTPYCENRSPCCDKVWAGYCREKTREQAFWSHCSACSPPLGCRINCRLEMIATSWRQPAACAAAGSTENGTDKCQADQYQAEPAPAADAAQAETSPKVPDPPKPEKQSQRKGLLSGLFR
jgi:hypothetical protein